MPDSKISRRTFLAKGTLALGAVAACDLVAGLLLGGALKAFASEQPKEVGMPHVSVKLWPGRSEEDKQRLAEAITQNVAEITGAGRNSISVSIEEVDPGQWKDEVYDPLMRMDQDLVYKKPGYSM